MSSKQFYPFKDLIDQIQRGYHKKKSLLIVPAEYRLKFDTGCSNFKWIHFFR